MSWKRRIGWGVMTFFAVAIGLYAVAAYGGLNPDNFFPEQRDIYVANLGGLMMHIAGAVVALVIGPFLFLPATRRKRWRPVHRWVGRLYMLGILLGALGGLYMAQMAWGGLVTRLGFTALAILWMFVSGMALWRVRQRDFKAHQRWIIRSYALTFAAVMLRLQMPLYGALGIDPMTAYQMTAWTSWIPNLIVAEIIIWQMGRPRKQRSQLNPAAGD